ncbi:tyrosinase precursor [Phlyctema vagabunda]|uniref:Tyrosinase n=1 Tax=Phlyctema vagabunda TaxID=108571 RepID=A0ABR4P7F6_9HELO
MFASFGVLLLLLLQKASAASYDYGIDTHSLVPRQAISNIIITGALPSSNGVRREIRDLEKDNTTWTLYLLAMDMMQYTNQSDMQSWYQLAGIHGRPFVSWDGVPAAPGLENNGYCSHVSVLFPTWHRPYLALLEQALNGMTQYIASLYPEGPVRDQYAAAALNFRIPYWDWARAADAGKHTTPDSIMSPTAVVEGPMGAQEIHNPLFSYEFKPLESKALPEAPFNGWTETKRWPTNQTASAVSQNLQMARALDQSATSLRNRLFNLLAKYDNYTQFSNEAYSPEGENDDSVESIHDFIHGYTGNGGHMTYIEYSAFDPIFFLHHTMVDRIFALWQVLYPDSWILPEASTYSTFTSRAGTIEDSASALLPFRNDANGNFWTSDSSRSISTFGYEYPETVAQNGTDQKTQVSTAINNLYGTGSLANLAARDRFTVRRSQSEVQNRALSILGSEGLPLKILQSNLYREWIVNIRVKKYALDAPFMINVFLGPYNSDPSTWPTEPNFVGSHYVFTKASIAAKQMASCSGCKDQIISGTVPLTSALLADIASGDLGSLDLIEVVPYLQSNLRYRVSTIEGEDAGIVESLSVSVASAEVQKSLLAGLLPKWGELETVVDNVLCG